MKYIRLPVVKFSVSSQNIRMRETTFGPGRKELPTSNVPGQLNKFTISRFVHTQEIHLSELIRNELVCTVTSIDIHDSAQPAITSPEVMNS